MYGRKPVFLAAILIFLAGSALSGLSQSMGQLIAFRAIQGVGAGGLMVGAQAIIADIVPPRDRGRYMGLIGSVFAVASRRRPAARRLPRRGLLLALGVLRQPADRRRRGARRRDPPAPARAVAAPRDRLPRRGPADRGRQRAHPRHDVGRDRVPLGVGRHRRPRRRGRAAARRCSSGRSAAPPSRSFPSRCSAPRCSAWRAAWGS